jgi:general secretion pathway protein G
MTRTNKAVRGFSLIELVIVIAVIAILAALLAPTILGQAERARASRARSDVAELGKQIARMRTDTGSTGASCLTTLSNLTSLTIGAGCPAAATTNCTTATPGYVCWGGPYSVVITNDPWNAAYTVDMDPNTFAVTVYSAGPDGTYGDSDDLTFIQ